MTLGETWNSRASCAWIPRRGRPPSSRRRRRTAHCRTRARRWRTALIFRRPALLAQVSSQLTGADHVNVRHFFLLAWLSDKRATRRAPACAPAAVAVVSPRARQDDPADSPIIAMRREGSRMKKVFRHYRLLRKRIFCGTERFERLLMRSELDFIQLRGITNHVNKALKQDTWNLYHVGLLL